MKFNIKEILVTALIAVLAVYIYDNFIAANTGLPSTHP
jgi:hypothetical protein